MRSTAHNQKSEATIQIRPRSKATRKRYRVRVAKRRHQLRYWWIRLNRDVSALTYALTRTVLIVFVVAVAFNFPWELAQAPLYQGLDDRSAAAWHCFVASLGDGVLVLVIFSAGLCIWQRIDWFEHPRTRGYLLILATGFVLALTVEWVAVHFASRWSYTDRMPRLLGLEIGLVPILQMLVLPPLVFFVAKFLVRRLTNRH